MRRNARGTKPYLCVLQLQDGCRLSSLVMLKSKYLHLHKVKVLASMNLAKPEPGRPGRCGSWARTSQPPCAYARHLPQNGNPLRCIWAQEGCREVYIVEERERKKRGGAEQHAADLSTYHLHNTAPYYISSSRAWSREREEAR